MSASLSEIAALVQGQLVGETSNIQVNELSPIEQVKPGSLVFAEGADNLRRAEQSEAAVILVGLEITSSIKPVIQVPHPLKAFITLIHYFHPQVKQQASIHPSAAIANNVTLGKNVSIGAGCIIEEGAQISDNVTLKGLNYIGRNVIIGEDTVLHAHVTVYDNCQLGKRVSIHASSVIGSDGFGYTFTDGQHLKIPHVGHVIIEDDVEIGANSVVDRATLGATVIGEGTKIDNFVQVAHSVRLGKHNILCGFTGIAGSTTSGNGVIFAANVGVSDHVLIDDNVILGARAGVPPKKHLLKGNIYLGNPARPKEKAIEQELSVTRIPIMRKNLRALSEKVDNLCKKLESVEKES